MDPKRPDVQLDDSPEEEGIVTKRERKRDDSGFVASVRETIRSYLQR